jgi:uncharacterized membrane protein
MDTAPSRPLEPAVDGPADPGLRGSAGSTRLVSIDIVRGLVMVLMAIDHVRDYFTKLRFEPETLDLTYPSLFLTRWVTHLCAPGFFLLAGTGAFLYAQRHGEPAVRRFLLTRGVWLIVLEFTLVGTAWSFQVPWGFFGVIWCLGASMIVVAGLTLLRPRGMLVVAIVVIAAHDLLDPIRPSAFGSWGFLWSLVHVRGGIHIGSVQEFVLFPLVPWCAVMALGYAIGPLFLRKDRGQPVLLRAGWAALAVFAMLRLTNVYGNPPVGLGGVSQGDWHLQPTMAKSVILFFDVEKYPPSLQFLLMTLGVICLLLWGAERWRDSRLLAPLIVFGRVPLFFYVAHLYVIHALAVFAALLAHQPTAWLFHGAIFGPEPDTYGFGLPVVYAVWALVVLLLYWPCKRLAALKQSGRYPWLSYA